MKLQNLLFVLLVLSSTMIFAQEEVPLSEEEQEAALAKATQNPLAAMYSLPFQNNTTFDFEPYGRNLNVLNIQPVIPVSISENINLVNRIIIPVITQPSSFEDASSTGLGDTSYSAWFSPAKAGKIIYGVGPVFQIPTSTGREYGSGEFGIGPSVVVLAMIDQWVAGFLTNNTWTFGDAKENKLLFQYFINYNLPKAWYVAWSPAITANWNAPKDQRWVVPLGGGGGKVFKLGKLPINASAQAFYNAVKPDNYGDWQLRVQVQFLFPKGKK